MATTESEIVELMNKRIDAAFAEEKDRKTARNRARVNFHALTVGSRDRPGVRTLDQVAKYLADDPHEYSLQAIRDRFAPAASLQKGKISPNPRSLPHWEQHLRWWGETAGSPAQHRIPRD
jgi:hypothetical protein